MYVYENKSFLLFYVETEYKFLLVFVIIKVCMKSVADGLSTWYHIIQGYVQITFSAIKEVNRYDIYLNPLYICRSYES